MGRHRTIEFIPPLKGEVIDTPDGKATVQSTSTYKDLIGSEENPGELYNRLRARMGDNFYKRYFRVFVELKDSGEMETYHSWEVREAGWSPDRDTDTCWRDFNEP